MTLTNDIASTFSLTGKVAIVTGAAAGIGEATAGLLAAVGATVIVADRDLDGAENAAAAIGAAGGVAVARSLDVSDVAAVTALVEGVVSDYGSLDILVNNAGIMTRRAALDISPEEFTQIISVNLNGVLYGCQAAGRVMKSGALIVNMLSEIIDRGTAFTGSYAAAKKGAEALTRTFAVELGAQGIRVNGVAPAWTVSAMTRQRATDANGEFDENEFDAVKARLESLSPLGTVNDPIDIAYAVLYLASVAGRNISGQIVRVNGGSSMH